MAIFFTMEAFCQLAFCYYHYFPSYIHFVEAAQRQQVRKGSKVYAQGLDELWNHPWFPSPHLTARKSRGHYSDLSLPSITTATTGHIPISPGFCTSLHKFCSTLFVQSIFNAAVGVGPWISTSNHVTALLKLCSGSVSPGVKP